MLPSMGLQRVGHNSATTTTTTTNMLLRAVFFFLNLRVLNIEFFPLSFLFFKL